MFSVVFAHRASCSPVDSGIVNVSQRVVLASNACVINVSAPFTRSCRSHFELRLNGLLLWLVLPGLLLTGQSAVKAQTGSCPGAWTFSAKTKSVSGVIEYYKNGVRQSGLLLGLDISAPLTSPATPVLTFTIKARWL